MTTDTAAFWRVLGSPLLVGAAVAGLFLAGVFTPVELMALDWRFHFRGDRAAASEVTVVGVTQACLSKLGQPPWPRSRYAQAIRQLKNAGARWIGMDVFFPATTVAAEDQALLAAVLEAGNVTLPVFCPVELAPGAGPVWPAPALRENFPALNRAAATLAHINVPPAADGKCRGMPWAISYDGKSYPALGVSCALNYLATTAQGGAAAGRNQPEPAFKPPPDGRFLVNYHGQQHTFDFIPFHKVLDGTFPKTAVAGRPVLVGQTAMGLVNADLISTPNGLMYGMFVQAIAMDNLLTGEVLRQMRHWEVAGLILALGLLAGVLFRNCPPLWLAGAWLAGCAMLWGGAVLLFNSLGLVLEVTPLLAVFTGTLGLAAVGGLRQAREEVRLKDASLNRIFAASRVEASRQDLAQLPDVLMRLIGEQAGAELVTMTLAEPAGMYWWQRGSLRPNQRRNVLEVEAIRAFEAQVNPALMARGVPCLIRRGEEEGSRLPPGLSLPAASFLCVPLRAEGHTFGLIHFYNKRPTPASPAGYFTEEDAEFILLFARQMTLLMENNRLVDRLAAANRELQTALERLQSAQSALVRRERLAAVGEMAAMIVHDIRGPLTVAGCYAELAGRDPGASEGLQQMARKIQHEVARVNTMACDVLEFACGVRSLTLAPVTVASLMTEFQERFTAELAGRGVTMTVDHPPHGQCLCDRDKLLNVLLNLARNAVEAMANGGRLTMVCRCDAEAVSFVLADTGPGIPAEILGHLFEPFSSFGKARGTGLGLAIVRKTVEDHGGTIRADSAAGRGATFTIRLPVPAPPPAAASSVR